MLNAQSRSIYVLVTVRVFYFPSCLVCWALINFSFIRSSKTQKQTRKYSALPNLWIRRASPACDSFSPSFSICGMWVCVGLIVISFVDLGDLLISRMTIHSDVDTQYIYSRLSYWLTWIPCKLNSLFMGEACLHKSTFLSGYLKCLMICSNSFQIYRILDSFSFEQMTKRHFRIWSVLTEFMFARGFVFDQEYQVLISLKCVPSLWYLYNCSQ